MSDNRSPSPTTTAPALTACPACGGDGSKANAYLVNCAAFRDHRMGGFVWVARRCPEQNPDLYVQCWLDEGHDGPHNMEGARNQRWAAVAPPAPTVEPTRCQHIRDNLAYLHACEDAAERISRGERQQQCPVCTLWLWPHEMGGVA